MESQPSDLWLSLQWAGNGCPVRMGRCLECFVVCYIVLCPTSVGQTAEAEGKEGQIGLEKHHQCSSRDFVWKINSKLEFYLVFAISCMILFSRLSFQRPSVLYLFVPPLLQLFFPVVYSSSLSSGISSNDLSLVGTSQHAAPISNDCYL